MARTRRYVVGMGPGDTFAVSCAHENLKFIVLSLPRALEAGEHKLAERAVFMLRFGLSVGDPQVVSLAFQLERAIDGARSLPQREPFAEPTLDTSYELQRWLDELALFLAGEITRGRIVVEEA